MKMFAAFLLLLLIGLQFRLWVSDDGVRSLITLRHANAVQKAENEELARRNSELAGEVKDLKEGNAAVEEHARHDLGMVGRGETFYQIIDQALLPGTPEPSAGASNPVQRTAR